jgi:hypothetical protein
LEELQAHLRRTPPRCAQAFRLTSTPIPHSFAPENFGTAWTIGCACGSGEGAFLGYSDWGGERHPDTFSSPLAFECAGCGRVTEILDTRRHGWEVECGLESNKYRGEGARARYHCPSCGKDRFRITVAFWYWDAAFDELVGEPDLAAENYFNEFQAFGTCVDWGVETPMTAFGKL